MFSANAWPREMQNGSTGLSKRNGAKFREFSRNFPKLADWAVHGRSLCLAALGAGILKQGTVLLHNPVHLFGVINNQLSYSWEKRGFRHVITCKREFLETFNLISTRIVERKMITMRREL